MRALVLEPHQDDCVLFCAFNTIRHRAVVITVLGGGANAAERNRENQEAAAALGLSERNLWPWDHSDDDPDWDAVREHLELLTSRTVPAFEVVFAPWPEPGGHPQHNRVGELAGEVFTDRVVYYTTYRYGGPRTTGDPVDFTPEMVIRKLRALACYESQILRGPVRFFTHALDEYTRQP